MIIGGICKRVPDDMFRSDIWGTFPLIANLSIALYTDEADLSPDTEFYTTAGEVTDAGYTAGGQNLGFFTGLASTTVAEAALTYGDVSWSGAITARAALLYIPGTVDGDIAVAVLDFGSNKTSTTTFTLSFGQTSSDGLIRAALK